MCDLRVKAVTVGLLVPIPPAGAHVEIPGTAVRTRDGHTWQLNRHVGVLVSELVEIVVREDFAPAIHRKLSSIIRLVHETVIVAANAEYRVRTYHVRHIAGDRFCITVASAVRNKIVGTGGIRTGHRRLEHTVAAGYPKLIGDVIVGAV